MIDFNIHRLAENALLLKFKAEPSNVLLAHLLALKEVFSNQLQTQGIHAYNELILKSPKPLRIPEVENVIGKYSWSLKDRMITKKVFQLPVCYDKTFAVDLSFVAQEKNLSEKAVIDIHTRIPYLIYFLGFLPGFTYLEGLDSRLHIARRDEPRKIVQRGSVGIGGKQTGIYPQDSPGGWRLIGNCPVPLFDVRSDTFSPFSAGDYIQFCAVSLQEYEVIKREIEQGTYVLKITNENF